MGIRPRHVVAMLATLLLLAAGCGSAGAASSRRPMVTRRKDRSLETVVHAMGETEIPAQPRTIVALDNTVVDAAYSLGMPVAGFTTFDGGKELPDYLAEEFPELAAQAEYVGTLEDPNLETIAAMRPDLIISARVRHEQIYDELSPGWRGHRHRTSSIRRRS